MNELGLAVSLMMRSDFHRPWYIADLEDWIIPAIKNKRIQFFFDGDEAIGFFTYTFLPELTELGYLTKTDDLQLSDWETTPEDGRLYAIDFIAFRNVRQCVKDAGRTLQRQYGAVKDECHFFRYAKDRLGRIAKRRDKLCLKMAS
jgi:hemolysin-activating ACP:hemolysin acyltransferase